MRPAHQLAIALAIGAAVASASFEGGEPLANRASAQGSAAYRSPYRVAFGGPLEALVGDLQNSGRGDARLEGEMPFGVWYSRRTLERWRGWGPPARHYPAVAGLAEWPAERKRERVIAVALRFLGYGYQHHHIPDFDPPAGWPWHPTCAGRNGRGVDCSNLTAFVYNLGFGLRLSGDIHRQAEERLAAGPGPGRETRLHHVALPESYEDRLRTLRTGDLVFIRGRDGGHVTHVVIWVGPIGQAPDGAPLILDSHGGEVRDSSGQVIPCGVQLRPFHERSWYNHDASHAIRIFP